MNEFAACPVWRNSGYSFLVTAGEKWNSVKWRESDKQMPDNTQTSFLLHFYRVSRLKYFLLSNSYNSASHRFKIAVAWWYYWDFDDMLRKFLILYRSPAKNSGKTWKWFAYFCICRSVLELPCYRKNVINVVKQKNAR